MSEQEPQRAGLLAALQRLGRDGLELLQVRLSLLGTELEAEKLRLTQALMGMLLVLLLSGVALVLFSVLVILVCPEEWRWLAALVLMLAHGLGAWALWIRARAEMSAPGGMFAASLAELQRDRETLEDK